MKVKPSTMDPVSHFCFEPYEPSLTMIVWLI